MRAPIAADIKNKDKKTETKLFFDDEDDDDSEDEGYDKEEDEKCAEVAQSKELDGFAGDFEQME